MEFIDSHCHLDFERLGSVDTVLAAALEQDVSAFVVPSVSAHNWRKVLKLTQTYPQLYGALGIHPYFLESDNKLAELIALASASRNDIVAIGEIGLDGTIEVPINEQLDVLVAQLKLAKTLELPVICHAHKAYDPLLKQLRRFKLPRAGVIHGFSGSLVQANEFIKLGFKLGLGGVITYPRAQRLASTVTALELEHFLLETDSPDMPLYGQQGQLNTPVNIPRIAHAIAKLKQVSLADVANITSQQSRALFAL
ncbi:TatD family hydrolase [Psychrobium sp. 1_MG-2023]|uniref:TatD family hydrolase n=1 Tax=Psychrobium sp. 1_MG-2023 TaxID=3062624 RepID=UPI000C3374BC|nr:TatD family hydrolase [Psychrobium sp. 1_MG-2023]MDP2561802.1 TatD family hydrolase [Psychrobium sp. 1_MG-2023]PKF55824.1 DNAase [Alteromonadales bacterium alter-6D02]